MEPQRADDGRFVRRFDRLTFYDVLEEVALIVDPVWPERVTERAWNVSRHLSEEYEDVPLSWEIRRQLAGDDGVPIPWRQLLLDVFDGDRRNERIDNARRMAARADFMSDERVFHALNRVANDVYDGKRTLQRQEYVEGREIVLRRRRRRADRDRLAVQLPTIDQIETYTESFDRALEIAGLEPDEAREFFGKQAGVRIVEAGVRFYQRTAGYLPSANRLRAFARDFDFALEDPHYAGKRWSEVIEAMKAEIAQRGFPPPRPYRPHHDKPTWEVPEEKPWPYDPPYSPKTFYPTLASVVVPMAEYLELCRQRRREPGRAYYNLVRRTERAEWPSTIVLDRYGGFAAVRDIARRPNEVKKAVAELNPSEEEVARREEEELELRLQHPTPTGILRLLGESARPLSSRELGASLELNHRTMTNWLPLLVKAGKIERTTPSAVARNVKYCMPGQAPIADEALREKHLNQARRPNPREVYRLINSGEATMTVEIAEAMGRHRDAVTKWLRPLKYLGWIEETTEGGPWKGGKRTWYSVTDVEPEW